MSSTKRKASEISPSKNAGWSVGESDNFSDWIVQVVETDNSGNETSYHVHRKDLACGENSSEYFAGVFHSIGLRESESSVTRVELEAKVAQAFPAMLNFLYTGKLHDVRVAHIVPLFWLADYFVIESLQRPLKEVRRTKMSSSSRLACVVTIYQDAVALGHQETLDALLEHLNSYRCISLGRIRNSEDLLKALDPDFFLRLRPDGSGHVTWDEVVRKYVSLHTDEIDDDVFSKLVDKLYPSNECLDVGDIDKMLELLKACPAVNELPLAVQSRIIGSISNVSPELHWKYKLRLIWKVLEVVKSISDMDNELLSRFHASLDHFFKSHPRALENLQEDKVKLIHEYLPLDSFLKLFSTLQNQCKDRTKEIETLKRESMNQASEHRYELRKFHRFDPTSIKDKIVLSHERYSGEPKPELIPRRLPPGGEMDKKGWMYRPQKGAVSYPLYTYHG